MKKAINLNNNQLSNENLDLIAGGMLANVDQSNPLIVADTEISKDVMIDILKVTIGFLSELS